jgi:K+ transporter
VTPTPANVLGVLSLIIWALTLVVTVKYLSFSLLARNARPLDAYFGIPPGKVFEVGAQFDL